MVGKAAYSRPGHAAARYERKGSLLPAGLYHPLGLPTMVIHQVQLRPTPLMEAPGIEPGSSDSFQQSFYNHSQLSSAADHLSGSSHPQARPDLDSTVVNASSHSPDSRRRI